nr:hypothetical protein BgiMline_030401 [Biomphalaria glabrata]
MWRNDLAIFEGATYFDLSSLLSEETMLNLTWEEYDTTLSYWVNSFQKPRRRIHTTSLCPITDLSTCLLYRALSSPTCSAMSSLSAP